MASASQLSTDQQVIITAGEFKGQTVTVLDPTPVPDSAENAANNTQRKVLVQPADSEPVYILPRLIEDPRLTALKVTPAPAPVAPKVEVVGTHSPRYEGTRPVMMEDHPDAIHDPMDPRLDAYRPDPSIVKEYVSRKLPGGHKDTDIILNYWRARTPLLLTGETQSGKTMVIQVAAVLAAKEMGYPKPFPVFTLSGSSGVTDFDLFGQPTAFTDPETHEERIVWLPGLVDMAFRFGGFLYLDELNLMHERVTSSLHPATDDRRQFINRAKAVQVPGDGFVPEIVPAHEDTWVCGTYNDGYRGTGQMNEAFKNRFRHMSWDYDDAVEKKLIASETVRKIGEAMRNLRDTLHVITTPVGTRALQNLEEDAFSQGHEFALWVFVAMFPNRERDHVRACLEDRGFANMLQTEVKAVERQRKLDAGETVEAEPEPEVEEDPLAQFPQSKHEWSK